MAAGGGRRSGGGGRALDAERRHVLLLELAGEVALDEGRLADAAVADEHQLGVGFAACICGGGRARVGSAAWEAASAWAAAVRQRAGGAAVQRRGGRGAAAKKVDGRCGDGRIAERDAAAVEAAGVWERFRWPPRRPLAGDGLARRLRRPPAVATRPRARGLRRAARRAVDKPSVAAKRRRVPSRAVRADRIHAREVPAAARGVRPAPAGRPPGGWRGASTVASRGGRCV